MRHPVPERVGVGLVLRLTEGLRLRDGLEVAERETLRDWTAVGCTALTDGDVEPEGEKEEAGEEESLGLAEPDPELEPSCSTLRTAPVRKSTPGPPCCAAALPLLTMPVAGGVGEPKAKPSAGTLPPERRCARRPGA